MNKKAKEQFKRAATTTAQLAYITPENLAQVRGTLTGPYSKELDILFSGWLHNNYKFFPKKRVWELRTRDFGLDCSLFYFTPPSSF
jgi:hypothetical protein